jgi:hypothetical protein
MHALRRKLHFAELLELSELEREASLQSSCLKIGNNLILLIVGMKAHSASTEVGHRLAQKRRRRLQRII